MNSHSGTSNSDKVSYVISNVNVLEAIKTLKPNYSSGPDNIANIVYTKANFAMINYIQMLFNQIIRTQRFPTIWKLAKVTPIFKDGDRSKVNNYRPISNLNSLSKLFEKIIKMFVCHFLEQHHIISNNQHGFRQGFSTSTNLLLFTNFVNNAFIDKAEVHTVYLDFQKAFDKVNHMILIDKLISLDFDSVIVNLITSYLQDRQQFVVINGYHSNVISCPSGVPQGSVLGPILFGIFINDCIKLVKYSRCLLYADDMKIFKEVNGNSRDFDIHQLQLDINAIYNWSQDMNLPLNLEKSKYMIFNSCQSSTSKQDSISLYKIGSSILGSVSIHKDLGITFENNLSFDTHVKNIILTANHTNACLRKCFNFTSNNIRILLFNSFIRPHFDYGSIIWVAKNSMNNRIEKVLKSYTRHLEFDTYQNYKSRLIKLQ